VELFQERLSRWPPWRLQNDPRRSVLHALQLLNTAGWSTVQHSVAIVQPRQYQTASQSKLFVATLTLDDLELYKFELSVNFSGFRRFRTQQQLNEWRLASIVSDNVVSTSNWSNFWHAFVSRGFVSDSWAFLFVKYCWLLFQTLINDTLWA